MFGRIVERATATEVVVRDAETVFTVTAHKGDKFVVTQEYWGDGTPPNVTPAQQENIIAMATRAMHRSQQ